MLIHILPCLIGLRKCISATSIITALADHGRQFTGFSQRDVSLSHESEALSSDIKQPLNQLILPNVEELHPRDGPPLIWCSHGPIRIAITMLQMIPQEDSFTLRSLLDSAWNILQNAITKPGNSWDTVIPEGQIIQTKYEIGPTFSTGKVWSLHTNSVNDFQTTYGALQTAVALLAHQMMETGWMMCYFEVFDGQTRVNHGTLLHS